VFLNLLHILCFLEHHLKLFELDQINLGGYKLGATYCRKFIEYGGVCIFVHKNLNYLNINLSKYCKDQDIEVCALKLDSIILNICVIAVYRAPCGNFKSFLIGLDSIIKSLYKVELKFIICGDTDYLTKTDKKNTTSCYVTVL
jgi:hypothetical protein